MKYTSGTDASLEIYTTLATTTDDQSAYREAATKPLKALKAVFTGDPAMFFSPPHTEQIHFILSQLALHLCSCNPKRIVFSSTLSMYLQYIDCACVI